MDVFDKLTLHIPDTDKPRIVIIGGGFAGIEISKKLKNLPVQLVLLDRHNYYTFIPLLYQVATAGLEPDSVAWPLRKLMEDFPDSYFRMAKVNRIAPEEKKIYTAVGALHYDYLIIASGSRTNYFGMEDKFKLSFPLKRVPQALDLRSHILQNFEKVVMTQDEEEKNKLLTFCIVGGGPTGVEVAGALGELKQHVLPKDYPEIDFAFMRIVLIEGTGRLLNGMSEKSGKRALQYLKDFGVDVRLNTMMDSYNGQEIFLKGGEKIQSQTLVWAAGVQGNVIDGFSEDKIIKGRIAVDAYNRVAGYEDIFAVGDVAVMRTEHFPNGHPMLAPVAIQQGKHLAKNFKNLLEKAPLKPFKYFDKGYMATIGRKRAVVDLPKRGSFGGFFAWLIWMVIHLFFLIGFRNKLIVLFNWAYNYFTYDRGIRLIIRTFINEEKNKKKE